MNTDFRIPVILSFAYTAYKKFTVIEKRTILPIVNMVHLHLDIDMSTVLTDYPQIQIQNTFLILRVFQIKVSVQKLDILIS